MARGMGISIDISLDGRFSRARVSREVDEVFRRAFEPIRYGDCGPISAMTDISTAECRVVLKLRQDAAEFIATEIAEMLIEQMKSKDTLNGYSIEEQKQWHAE
jgi:hypothetical protein